MAFNRYAGYVAQPQSLGHCHADSCCVDSSKTHTYDWRSISCNALVGDRRCQESRPGGAGVGAGHFVCRVLETGLHVCALAVEPARRGCSGFDPRIFRGAPRARPPGRLRSRQKPPAHLRAPVYRQLRHESRKSRPSPETRRRRDPSGSRFSRRRRRTGRTDH